MNRWILKEVMAEGQTIYEISHEVHNVVTVVFPAGYWLPAPVPSWIMLTLEIEVQGPAIGPEGIQS